MDVVDVPMHTSATDPTVVMRPLMHAVKTFQQLVLP